MAKGGEEIIVIKKVKKGHGGHHGGAWKVAYADFVTAMMALFLVLWLVAMLSKDAKKSVAEYFRSYTIFKGDEAGGGKGMSIMIGSPVKLDPEPGDLEKKKEVIKNQLAFDLGKVVEDKLNSYKEQIRVFNTSEGVRLELMEMEQSPMFESGKANLLPRGKEVLQIIAASLKDLNIRITIEGHTDGHKYPSDTYTNWELAADRANAARRELLKNSLDPAKITKVASYADAVPIIQENPYDSLNRRVSILMEPNVNPVSWSPND